MLVQYRFNRQKVLFVKYLAYFDSGHHVILKLTTNHHVLMTNYTTDLKNTNKIILVKVLDPGYRNITSYEPAKISAAKIYK